MIRRWLLIAIALTLLSGTTLSLPAFWDRPVVGETTGQKARHWLDCVFTASSALTGTALTRYDIGDDFNSAGQALILGLMQTGGLAILIAGGVVGWRFRRRFGWGSGEAEHARGGLRRLLVFTCVLALLIEAIGTAVLYYAGDPGSAAPRQRLFAAAFQSVSAFCNAGLTLTQDSLTSQRQQWIPYGLIAPLMVLGSIGGPVLYELYQRLWRRGTGRPRLSRDARVTLLWTAGLIVAGTGLLLFTESTPHWQLRNPREDTERIRLNVASEPSEDDSLVFSPDDSDRVKSERMRTMTPGWRAAAAFFHSVSARSGGFRVARLDEESLSPAGRLAMMGLMLFGGGLGGTAGGLRIVVVVLLLGALRSRATRPDATTPQAAQDADPAPERQNVGATPHGQEGRATRAAAAVATAMVLLIAAMTLVLVYREAATVEACQFEAVSAVCNVGFSTGLTRRLSIGSQVESEVMLILVMLLGRILPLALLARYAQPITTETQRHGEES